MKAERGSQRRGAGHRKRTDSLRFETMAPNQARSMQVPWSHLGDRAGNPGIGET